MSNVEGMTNPEWRIRVICEIRGSLAFDSCLFVSIRGWFFPSLFYPEIAERSSQKSFNHESTLMNTNVGNSERSTRLRPAIAGLRRGRRMAQITRMDGNDPPSLGYGVAGEIRMTNPRNPSGSCRIRGSPAFDWCLFVSIRGWI
jgi:hypothetical protein